MNRILLISFTLLFTASNLCRAQNKPEVLTNTNVVSLVKAGLPKSVILTTISNSESNFDISANAIINLKKQGVPDDLIEAIVNKGSGNSSSASGSKQAAPKTGNDNILASLEPGIYYLDEAGKPVSIEASVFSQAKTGSGVLTGLTYGIAKTKSKAVLSGTSANTKIKNTSPVFYFVFPHNNGTDFGSQSGGIAGWYSSATSPNEFLLIKFKVAKKGREVVTGSFGTYSGFSGGIDDENKVTYRFSKLSSGIYKVYFESPISGGEFAFIFAGASASTAGGTPAQKAYDFSIVK